LNPDRQVTGRFAPSPTGDFHAGNARTALLAWLQARAAGGRFLLRMEDLDAGRVRAEYYRSQMEDLRWLGLDWDEGPDVGGPKGPYLQSQREPLYDAALEELSHQGLLYECFCSRREIAAAAMAPHGGDDEGPRYPGTCRRIAPDELDDRRARRDAALRFRTPSGPVRFHDLVHGDVVAEPSAEVGDFVVRRRDGVAAYQLAVTVDDAAMDVTHVVRGADLIPSTARQILLYRALGATVPVWIHVPLMVGADGERLAKRHRAPTLRELRESGMGAPRVVGWLAASCGLAEPGMPMMPSDLLSGFEISDLPAAPTVLPPGP
jgi:glutamyl-tRNA synthetase